MESPTRSVVAGAFGVVAGLGAAISPLTCAGAACASCFACVGLAGATASLLLARLALRGRRHLAGTAAPTRASRAQIGSPAACENRPGYDDSDSSVADMPGADPVSGPVWTSE